MGDNRYKPVVFEFYPPAEGGVGVVEGDAVAGGFDIGLCIVDEQYGVICLGVFECTCVVEHQNTSVGNGGRLLQLMEPDGDAELYPFGLQRAFYHVADSVIAAFGGAGPVAVELDLSDGSAFIVRSHCQEPFGDEIGVCYLPPSHCTECIYGDVCYRYYFDAGGDRRDELRGGDGDNVCLTGDKVLLGSYIEHPQIYPFDPVFIQKFYLRRVGVKGGFPVVDGVSVGDVVVDGRGGGIPLSAASQKSCGDKCCANGSEAFHMIAE